MLRLKAIRESKLITQKELSIKTGLTIATISFLENGHTKPRFGTIRILAQVLGVEPSDLIRE